jgi:fibronectin-binding autotransporter adhesin
MKPKGLARTLLGTSALTAIVVGFTASTSFAADWVGDSSQNWNDPLNWNGDVAPTGNFVINSAVDGIYPIINSAPTFGPVDLFIGNGGGNTGRLDQSTGLLQTAVTGTNGNWAFVGTSGGTGTYNLTGDGSFLAGKLWIGGHVYGENGTGIVNIDTTGSVTLNSTDDFSGWGQYQTSLSIGWGATGNGTLNLINGTINSPNRSIYVGSWGGTGALNQSGGTINANGLTIGKWFSNATTASSVNISGGTFNTQWVSMAAAGNGGDVTKAVINLSGSGVLNSEGDVRVAQGGAAASFGEINIGTGSTFNVGTTTKRWLIVNEWDTAQGRVNVNGGTLNLNADTDIRFSTSGNTGTSSVTLNNGAINGGAGSVIDLNRAGAAVDNTVNLNGGTLTIGQIVSTNTTGTRVVNFNGGTLKAAGDNANFFAAGAASSANVLAGGATVDSNGFNVGIGQVLGGTGGLTKSGAGTLTLSAVNTYTGATTVNAGTLALDASASLASTQISVSSGATFDVSAQAYSVGSGVTLTNNGTVNGGFSVATGGTLNGSGTFSGAVAVNGALNPGNSPGVQTFASGLTLGSASVTTMEIAGLGGVAGTDFDFINVTGGTLTHDGSLAIVDFGGFDISAQTGTFNLFDMVAGTGDFDTVTVDGNSLTYNGGSDDWSSTVGNTAYNFSEGTGVLSVTVVPEPTAALLGGLSLLGLLRRRRVA